MADAIDFYYMDISSCSRMVWMILEELGVKYNSCILNLRKGEHLTEEYKKINPRQKVPAIKDGDLCLGESRAIATYLVNQYGAKQGKQSLYPVEPKERAVVDQHLYISEDIWTTFRNYCNNHGVFSRGETSVNHELFDGVKKYLKLIEDTLGEKKYIAANNITLADYFYYVCFQFLDASDFEFGNFPKIVAWRKRMSELSYHQKTFQDPQQKFKKVYKDTMAQNIEKLAKK